MRRLNPLLTPMEGLALCEALYLDGEGLRLMRHLLPAGSTDADALRLRNHLKQEQRRFSKCMAQQDAVEHP